MKLETEFREFLTTVKRSSKTGKIYSSKVAGDMVRRCKAAELVMNIELSAMTVKDGDFIEEVCNSIRVMRLTSTDSNPNNHNALIHAVKVYREFVTSRC